MGRLGFEFKNNWFMDTSHIELLKGIENAISTPRVYDWLVFVIAVINVGAFVFLSIYIYKLNKKVAKNQDDLLKSLFSEYDVSEDLAFNDVTIFLNELRDHGMLIEDEVDKNE